MRLKEGRLIWWGGFVGCRLGWHGVGRSFDQGKETNKFLEGLCRSVFVIPTFTMPPPRTLKLPKQMIDEIGGEGKKIINYFRENC